MNYNLEGKLTMGGAIALDDTLTLRNAAAQAKAVGDALEKKADKAANGTVVSENADYAEIGWWLDGNTTNEDRTGYFVCIDDNSAGTGMRKATSFDDVRGVVVTNPAFAGNATEDKFDSAGRLLPKYDYVGIMGFVSVIDDGSCVVNERCMPNDDGIATASSNRLGYHVIERLDDRHVLIAIEPNGDMVQRIHTDVLAVEEGIFKLNDDVTALEENKVDKAEGKMLSANDFTDEYKEKLDSIEEGANKYDLGDGAVTKDKIADGAVSDSKTIALAVAGWTENAQTVEVGGVTATNTVVVSPSPENFIAYCEAQVRCIAQNADSLTFRCEDVPEIDLTVNVTCINK